MLGAPNLGHPVYGWVTNSSNFVFLKLAQQEVPYYGRSKEFVLGNDDDLAMVLRIMKRLTQESL